MHKFKIIFQNTTAGILNFKKQGKNLLRADFLKRRTLLRYHARSYEGFLLEHIWKIE